MNNESQQQQIPEAKLNPEKPRRHCHCYLSYDTACPSSSGFPSHTHTHRLTMLLPVKVSKAARWKSEKQRVMQMLNGEWKMLSCWRFAVHSTWQRHVDWPAQPPLCDVKQNPDQIWYSYLCGINMHIYICMYINLNQLKSNCSAGFVGESSEKADN